ALCLTHDVDLITQDPGPGASARQLARDAQLLLRRAGGPAGLALRNIMRAVYRIGTLRGLGARPLRGYDAWLELERRHGFHSTFFFFPARVAEAHVYDCLYGYDDLAT